jgi:high-affinity nickel permease
MNFPQPLLLVTSLVLGLRHGIDWDHIAAITDIVTAVVNNNDPEAGKNHNLQLKALLLTACYAVGHSTIVITLGLLAICFRAILPIWIDSIMERIVGITLLILGIWVFYSLNLYFQNRKSFRLKSRWTLLWSLLQHFIQRVQNHFGKPWAEKPFKLETYGLLGSFIVGIIHGIGAETGTQVLIIASVSSTNQSTGLAMLVSFATGLLLSNLALATVETRGFILSYAVTPVLITASIATGIFGITIGSLYVAGLAKALPDLQKLMGV